MAEPSESPSETIVVLTTAANQDEASRLSRELVERRLAACVTVIPAVRSIYRWQGEIEDQAEVLLMVKTSRARFDSLASAIRELHSYDVPEVIALPAAAVEPAYASWLAGCLKPD